MRKTVGLLSGLLLGALSFSQFSLPSPAGAGPARASDKSDIGGIETIAAANAHQSFVRVQENGGAPIRKNIKIGLGKSVLIEFPRDVRDVMV